MIHPSTISAAVLQDAGVKINEHDRSNSAPFDAMTLAPDFDALTGRKRLAEVANLIAQWEIKTPPEDTHLATPPGDMETQDFMDFKHVQLNRRASLDVDTYSSMLAKVTSVDDHQLLSFHVVPMLKCMGKKV